MPQLNKLERAILGSAERAQGTCMRMTGGWWLWHAPESFLQHQIARAIVRTGNEVFTEASPAKIAREHNSPLRGRPAHNKQKRFDIVVWQRSQNLLRAAIEIKRTSTLQPVVKDAVKLRKYLDQRNSHGVGYLLVYSEAKGANRVERLRKRASSAAAHLKATGWTMLSAVVHSPRSSPWSWSVYLLRYGSTLYTSTARRPANSAR